MPKNCVSSAEKRITEPSCEGKLNFFTTVEISVKLIVIIRAGLVTSEEESSSSVWPHSAGIVTSQNTNYLLTLTNPFISNDWNKSSSLIQHFNGTNNLQSDNSALNTGHSLH